MISYEYYRETIYKMQCIINVHWLILNAIIQQPTYY